MAVINSRSFSRMVPEMGSNEQRRDTHTHTNFTIGDLQLSFHFAKSREQIEFNPRFSTETFLQLSIAFSELIEMLTESFRVRFRFAIFQCLRRTFDSDRWRGETDVPSLRSRES